MLKIALFQKTYDTVMSLCHHPRAEFWLGVVSFIESSFFFIPADVMFVPMALADRSKVLRYAFIATVMSVLGGIFGYYIGYYGYEEIAKPFLEKIGKLENLTYYRDIIKEDVFILWGLLLSSGFTHIPPIKVITILSGVANIPISVFIISAIIGRGARFYILGYLLYIYGDQIKTFIEKRLTLISIGLVLLLVALYVMVKIL